MEDKEEALNLFTQNASIFMGADNEGFIIGGPAKVVPKSFVKAYNNKGLSEIPLKDYDNIDLHLNLTDLMDGAAAMAQLTVYRLGKSGERLTIYPKTK